MQLCQLVNSPAVKLLYDIYHMQIMEGDLIRTIQQNHEWFGHYHTAGNPGRGQPDESQEIYYPAVYRAIAATGADRIVSHEFLPAGDPMAALDNGKKIKPDCHVGMTEQLLHGADIGAALQEVRRERMPQRVWGHRLCQPALSAHRFTNFCTPLGSTWCRRSTRAQGSTDRPSEGNSQNHAHSLAAPTYFTDRASGINIPSRSSFRSLSHLAFAS